MRICFINPPGEYYSPVSGGAISTIIMEMSRELIARGHHVLVATEVNGDEPYGVAKIAPLHLPVRQELPWLRRAVSSLRRRIYGWDLPGYDDYRNEITKVTAEWQPDATIVFNDLVSPAALRKVLPRSRIAVWFQNEWRTRQRSLSRTRAATDRFFACSQYIRHWTAVEHDIPLSAIRVIPSGVNLDTFQPGPEPRPKGAPLRVLFLGRLDPNKGPDLVADAVAELQRSGVPICLTVAGGLWWYGHGREMENPFFRDLKTKMDDAHATYAGHVQRPCVPKLLREHDVVCVLSRSNEPFALVTLEAMASGCAVVASDRGGLPEACSGAAMLVDPDNFCAVVSCLRSLAEDPALLEKQKARSLGRARQASWAMSVERLERELALP